MSESLTDLLATDAELDLIASRQGDCTTDLVLAEFALLAAAVDAVPLPPVIRCGSIPAMSSARKGGWALSVTVALMVTSSGVAAAVSEDPLAPLHYVTNQVWKIGPHDGAKVPGWSVNGSMPISTVPAGLIPGASVPVGGSVSAQGGGTGQASVSGDGSGDAGSGTEVGSGTGSTGRSGTGSGGGPGTGHGGRTPSSGSGSGSGSGPGQGHGGNSGPHSPPGGGGRGPTNVGQAPGPGSGNSEGPSGPSRPGEPVEPHRHNEHATQPNHAGFGEVQGTGSGSGSGGQHCRVDHPSIPGESTWSDAAGLHPCTSPSVTPVQPVTPQQPLAPQQPKQTATPPAATGVQPISTGTTPSRKPQTSQTRGSLR